MAMPITNAVYIKPIIEPSKIIKLKSFYIKLVYKYNKNHLLQIETKNLYETNALSSIKRK